MSIEKTSLKVITQAELAKIAKLSRKTVSRALTGHSDVNEESRQKIIQIAMQHNYRPSAAANAMRTGKSCSIALLQSSRNSIHAEMLNGIMDALNLRGLSLILSKLPTDESEELKAIPRILKENTVDGFLINYLVDIHPKIADSLEHQSVPAVWMNVEQEYNCVRPDDREAGRRLAEHLVASGCEEIFFLRNMSTQHYSEEQHYNGYLDAMIKENMPPIKLEKYDDSNYDCINQVFSSVRDTKKKSVGLITFDIAGIHAVGYLAGLHGISISKQLKLATFLPEKRKRDIVVPFDYLVSGQYEMGYKAVESICDMISNNIFWSKAQVLPFIDNFKVFNNSPTTIRRKEK